VERCVAAGGCGARGAFGRVGCDAGDFEVAEEAVDGGGEPGGVAGLQDDGARVELAQGGEELVGEAFVEGEFGRELDEERAELFAEADDLIEEGLQECASVDELGLMGDGFGDFYGEAEIGWSGGGPALPGLEPVGRWKLELISMQLSSWEQRCRCEPSLGKWWVCCLGMVQPAVPMRTPATGFGLADFFMWERM